MISNYLTANALEEQVLGIQKLSSGLPGYRKLEAAKPARALPALQKPLAKYHFDYQLFNFL
jgi:hypothetical protein